MIAWAFGFSVGVLAAVPIVAIAFQAGLFAAGGYAVLCAALTAVVWRGL